MRIPSAPMPKCLSHYPFDLAGVEDEEIVAATLHLRETHKLDSTGRAACGCGEKIPLGSDVPSLIFPL